METTPLKYADLISKSEDQKKSEEVVLAVEEAKASLTVTIARAKADLAKRQRELKAVQSANPYQVNDELALEEELKMLSNNITRAEQILAERF